MISERAKEAFLHLSLHAKIHEKIDSIPWYQDEIHRIDKAKIRAYQNDDEYWQLDAIKKEISMPKYKNWLKYKEWLPLNAEKVYKEFTGK